MVLRKIKSRLRKGHNLDKIHVDLQNEGVADKDLNSAVTHLIKEHFDEKHSDHVNKTLLEHFFQSKFFLTLCAIALMALIWFGFAIIGNDVWTGKWDHLDINDISSPNITKIMAKAFPINREGATYLITPTAEYEATGLVVSKNNINDTAKISPVDLLIVWGDFAKEKHSLDVLYLQIGRTGMVLGGNTQSYSQNHIIPANASILNALEKIETPAVVHLKGKVVTMVRNGHAWKPCDSNTNCRIIYLQELTELNYS
jgi:hypothetical protein